MSKESTSVTPPKKLSCKDDHPHHRSLLRQMASSWTPANVGEAKEIAEECYGRAESLASILSESSSDLRVALEVLDDLLYLGYGMLEWWDDEAELIARGWQPPAGKEGRAP